VMTVKQKSRGGGTFCNMYFSRGGVEYENVKFLHYFHYVTVI